MADNLINYLLRANASQAIAELKKVNDSFGGLQKSAITAKNTILTMLGGMSAGYGFAQFGKELLEATVAIDRIRNSLRAVSGNSIMAGENFDFIRSETKRLGLDLETAATSFMQLQAAARNTNISTEQVRKTFTAVSEAATVLGLSADDTAGAVRALYQIISKGKVQAEEIRGQLGERLYGAAQLAAQAMGMTNEQFSKALETGKVYAEEFIPKFTEVVHRLFEKDVPESLNKTDVALRRLSTAFFELKVAIADAGFRELAKDLLTGATSKLEEFRGVVKEVGGDIAALKREFDSILSKSPIKPNDTGKTFFNLLMDADAMQFIEVANVIDKAARSRVDPKAKAQRDALNIARGPQIYGSWELQFRDKQEVDKRTNAINEAAEKARTEAADAAAKLAQEWEKIVGGLQLTILKSGLSPLDAKLAEITAKYEELRKKFGNRPEIAAAEKADRIDAFAQDGIALAREYDYGENSESWDKALREDRKGKVKAHDDIVNYLKSDEEVLRDSYQSRADIIANSDWLSSDEQFALLDKLDVKFATEMDKLKDKNATVWDDMKEGMKGWASQFSSTLNEAFWAADASFTAIAESFAKMITQIIIQKQIVEPMMGAMQGIGTAIGSYFGSTNANGNVFSGGHLQAFANGGVVYRPTVFPMANGMGLMGEAGPEAVMPLKRLANGKLGVQASGSTPNMTVNVVNNTGTPAKVRQGQTQFDGKGYVKTIFLELMDTDPTFRAGVRGAY